jgi:hypothetical protein
MLSLSSATALIAFTTLLGRSKCSKGIPLNSISENLISSGEPHHRHTQRICYKTYPVEPPGHSCSTEGVVRDIEGVAEFSGRGFSGAVARAEIPSSGELGVSAPFLA